MIFCEKELTGTPAEKNNRSGMSESVIADFVADFTLSTATEPEPVRGRVVMSPKRVILATGTERSIVPLSKIFDIRVGHVPQQVQEFFDDTVTIAYRRRGNKDTVIIEADDEKIDRFTGILFKAILNGSPVTIKHPAKVGGRLTDVPERRARLKVAEGGVEFAGLNDSQTIDLSTVVYYEKSDREIGGDINPVLTVRHMQDRSAIATRLAMESQRKMNILGRFLRLEYSDAIADVQDLSIPDSEMELLVGLYSGGGDADLARLSGQDASTVSMLLDSLEEKDLIMHGEKETVLTSKGRMIVGQRIEDVNA